MDRKIIPVRDDEAALVQAADRIEVEARAQAEKREAEASRKYKKSLRDPMVFFGNEDRARIVQRRDALKEQYRQKMELTAPPILIPEATVPANSVPPRQMAGTKTIPQIFAPLEKKDGPPLPEVLKEEFLQICPAFRKGGQLYIWKENHYEALSRTEVEARIKTVLCDKVFVPRPADLLGNIYKMLERDETIIGQPDSYPHLLAVRNGEIDLYSMVLGPSNPAHHLVRYLDVSWNGPQPCPIFTLFLDQIAGGDVTLKQRILEAVGYLLVSDYGAKRFVVFQGPGDTGKSLLGNLISSFFPPEACASLSDFQFGERFALSFIARAQLCLSMDLAEGVIDSKAVAVLKQITGGDLLSIEGKGRDAYSDRIRCKILFGTNHPVQLKSRDHAFARRLLLVPFRYPVPPERQDRNLLKKLKSERPGILYQALCAYHDVISRGYQFTGERQYGFKASQIVLDASPANTLADFVARCCDLDPDTFTPTESLQEAYLNFCNSVGHTAILDRAAFSRALNGYLSGQLRPDKQRVNGIPLNGYRGIKLKGGN